MAKHHNNVRHICIPVIELALAYVAPWGHMKTVKKSVAVLSLISGYIIGAAICFIAALAVTRSIHAAFFFSLVLLGFHVPIAILFGLALSKVESIKSGEESHEVRQRDIVLAILYIFASLPYWFAAVALFRGRVLLSLCLFLVYVAMAFYPLRAFFRVRVAKLLIQQKQSA